MTNANVTPISSAGQGGQRSPAYQLLSGKAYNPDHVYLDASDSKGHYEQMNTKVPPNILQVMDVIVGDSAEYRSRQDFVRDALVHHAHRVLTKNRPDDALALHLIDLQASTDRFAMRRRLAAERRQNLEDTRDMVGDMMRDRDYASLWEELARVESLAEDENLPEGVRDEYADLWHEMNDMVQRQKLRSKKRK